MHYINKVSIDTTDYIIAHGRQPKGTGARAFFIGCRNDLDKLFFAPRCTIYSEARRLTVQEAHRQGVDYVSVGS